MKTLLLSDRLPADLHLRLENWGAVMRVYAKQGTSVTGEICDAMALRAGRRVRGDEHVVRVELDEHDACVIELVWRSSTYRVIPNRQKLLRGHYVTQIFRPFLCRMCGLREHRYEDEIVASVMDFERLLRLHELRIAKTEHACA